MTAVALAHVVDVCCRHAWKIVLLFLVIAGAAFAYTTHHFAIDTDTVKLFPPDLPWRQHQTAFDQAFPLKADQIAVVIDALTPELAEQATTALTARLEQHPELFPVVYRPDGGVFFQHNGLLFLPTADVKHLTDQLIAAQPLLGPLAADPSLRGLMDVFARFLEGVERREAKLGDFERPIVAIADTIADVLRGKLHPLAWRTLFTGAQPTLRELRRFILVKPTLDYNSLQPGAKASAAIRADARELGLTSEHGVRVRLTGSVPLSDEEFGTLAQGFLLNSILTVAGVRRCCSGSPSDPSGSSSPFSSPSWSGSASRRPSAFWPWDPTIRFRWPLRCSSSASGSISASSSACAIAPSAIPAASYARRWSPPGPGSAGLSRWRRLPSLPASMPSYRRTIPACPSWD
jgi:hypothetical protein